MNMYSFMNFISFSLLMYQNFGDVSSPNLWGLKALADLLWLCTAALLRGERSEVTA